MGNAKLVCTFKLPLFCSTECSTVQTAKQSCELLLKVHAITDLRAYTLTRAPWRSSTQSSITVNSRPQVIASHICPIEERIPISQFSPQARVYRLSRRRHYSCAFLSHSASYETYWDLGLHGIAPAHGCEKAGSLLQYRSRCTCMYACLLSAGRTILTFQFRGAS